MQQPNRSDRPQARQQLRATTRDRLHAVVTAKRVRELESDWLFQSVSAAGRRRLLQEHGLLPR